MDPSTAHGGRDRPMSRLEPAPDSRRLARQLEFVLEVDRLKTVLRETVLVDASRRENSAEHSWHLALMAILLSEYSPQPVDLGRVIKMLLVHDIVEVDAGDTFCYDDHGNRDKLEREQRAAERLFGLLPEDQAEELRVLWNEFEDGRSAEARFATALDRLQPMLHNYVTEGHSWQRHGIRKHQVVERNSKIADGAPDLWSYAEIFLEEAVARGFLGE